MENNTLTAKEWLRKGFAPVKNLIADEDGSIQQKYFEFETESFAEKISWAEQIIINERKSTAHHNV